VKELCSTFQQDIDRFIQISGDEIRELNFNEKLLVIVDAVNLIRHISVRTFKLGVKCSRPDLRVYLQ